MTSKEIAELTGKEHFNVMRDIRKMLADLGEGVLKFEDTQINPQNGQSYPIFRLPKDLTITLVSGYNVVMRHRIVTRWADAFFCSGHGCDTAPAQLFFPRSVITWPSKRTGSQYPAGLSVTHGMPTSS